MKKLFFFFAVCFLFMMTSASFAIVPPPSTDINTYVLFAYSELSFKGGTASAGWGTVYGNIGVNNAAASSTTYNLEFGTGGYAFIADGFLAVGDHVRGDAGGSFWDLYANKINPAFAATIRDFGPVTFTLPVIPSGLLPVFPFVPNRALTNGASDLTIATGATYNFTTSPWRNVRINDNATVNFGPGTYDMRNLSLGKHVTINVTETTILQIDRMFDPNDFTLFGVGTNSGAKIYVGSYGVTGRVTNFAHNSEIHAYFFSPTGWLDIGGHNKLFGHYIANRISGDANNNVYLPPPPTFPCPNTTCDPPFSSTVLNNINDYVLFAYDQLEFKGGNLGNGFGYIFGNIGVNNAAPTTSYLSLIFASSHSAWIADGYQAVADRVRGDIGGSFWDLFANYLSNNFGADIRHSGPIPWTPPIIPTLSLPSLGFIPGPGRGTDVAPDLTIPGGATATITTSPLHNVRINDNATVTFGPGVFDMWNLSIGKNVTINVDDATILQIDVKFENNNGLMFGIGTHAGAKIYVGAYGLNPTTDKAANFSHGSEVHANFFSPTGVLDLGGQGNNLYGHFWALRITGDSGNTIFCDEPGCSGDSPISSVNPGVKVAGIQISIFPNPAKESFTLQINNSINQGSTLTLLDLTGKEILHTNLQLQEGVNNYPVNIAGITPGVYIVKLQTGTGVGLTKIIINR